MEVQQTVELRDAMDAALTLVAFLGGWLVKALFDRIKDLEAADRETARGLADLRVHLPTSYVHKDEFKAIVNEVRESLRRIEDRLADKADKET